MAGLSAPYDMNWTYGRNPPTRAGHNIYYNINQQLCNIISSRPANCNMVLIIDQGLVPLAKTKFQELVLKQMGIFAVGALLWPFLI